MGSIPTWGSQIKKTNIGAAMLIDWTRSWPPAEYTGMRNSTPTWEDFANRQLLQINELKAELALQKRYLDEAMLFIAYQDLNDSFDVWLAVRTWPPNVSLNWGGTRQSMRTLCGCTPRGARGIQWMRSVILYAFAFLIIDIQGLLIYENQPKNKKRIQ